MRSTLFATLVAFAAVLAVVAIAPAQCVGPNCPVPTRVTVSRISDTEFAINLDGKQIGNVDAAAQSFRVYDAESDTWGDTLPLRRGDWRERGVDMRRLRESTGEISAPTDKIPDDSKKLRVTVIGSRDARRGVVDAVNAEPNVASRVSLWSVEPDHWSLRDSETGEPVFRTTGTPTVYVQAPDGKVLHRQDDPKGVVGAIRKTLKPYNPDLDPDVRKTVSPTKPGNVPVSGFGPLLAMAGLGVGNYLWRRSHATQGA